MPKTNPRAIPLVNLTCSENKSEPHQVLFHKLTLCDPLSTADVHSHHVSAGFALTACLLC